MIERFKKVAKRVLTGEGDDPISRLMYHSPDSPEHKAATEKLKSLPPDSKESRVYGALQGGAGTKHTSL